jgi:HAD superfamily hydrolase (TIGR01509 family)
MPGFAAVIFDMDGVLVDGEPLHFRAVNELLANEGKAISLDEYKPYMGTKSGWSEMIEDFGLAGSRESYSAVYRELVLAHYRAESVALPGASELVRGLEETGMPIAVCSSSILPWVEACLSRIGLLDAFPTIVTGSDVDKGKPAPDIYLLAAARLGIAPQTCLAFEDAPAGIASAKAAGMTCWAVRTQYTQGLALPGPHREFESLADVNLGDIVAVAA